MNSCPNLRISLIIPIWFLLVYSSIALHNASGDSNLKQSEILHHLLEEKEYDNTHLPPKISDGNGTDKPMVVLVGLSLRSVENLDDVKMQYSVQMLFWQEWLDPRLNFSYLNWPHQYMKIPGAETGIWTPDIFFNNEKTGHLHQLIVPNTFTRLYPEGRVFQSYRLTLVLSCDMDLRSYPLDVQDCPMNIESYGWTTKEMILQWRKEGEGAISPGKFSTSRFRLKDIYTAPCSASTPTGSYSCLTLRIKFAREFGYYLIQIYLPCSMLVIVSWVSFWLDPSAVEARLSLGVTTILAVVTQTYGINQNAPPASYAKALDVWTAWCQAMVFGALLEFASVNYLYHKRKVKGRKLLEGRRKALEKEEIQTVEEEFIFMAFTRAKRIDKRCRLIFPAVFALFNVVYWCNYLV